MVVHARTVRDWHKLDAISAEEYIRRTAGSKVFEVLWQPLLHGKFGDLSGDISAAWLWSKLVDGVVPGIARGMRFWATCVAVSVRCSIA